MNVNLFHDLDASRHEPDSFVTGRGLGKWLSQIAARQIQVDGAIQARVLDGAHFTLPPTPEDEESVSRWGVTRGGGGYQIGYGLVSLQSDSPPTDPRIPKIGDDYIDTFEGLPSEDRPSLVMRSDGVLGVESYVRLTHGAIPADGAGSGQEPMFLSTTEWLGWPEVKWDVEYAGEVTLPPGGTFTDIAFFVPIARTIAGILYPLRTQDISLDPYVVTLACTAGGL